MRTLTACFALPLLALAGPAAQDAAEQEPDEGPFVTTCRQDYADQLTLDGMFVPAEADEIELWPETWSGELLLLEVLPQGSYVTAGDVIARFDTERIDDEITKAERDLVSAEIGHEATVEKARMEVEVADGKLRKAQRSLERARRSLEGWEQYELDFRRRSRELSARYQQHNIEDQEDELAQLEAMYRDDELVDATEEIVLKRSRRALATSRISQKLSEDRRTYEVTFDIVQQTEVKREAVDEQVDALDRLRRTQALDARSREDRVARSEEGLVQKKDRLAELRRDRELLVVRAPRSGILLHGGLASHAPGQVRPDHERGGRGAFRKPLFCVAAPDRFDVALSVSESQLDQVRTGQTARVAGLVGDTSVMGTLRLDTYPTPKSGAGKEGSFAGRVTLDRALPGTVAGMRAKVTLDTERLDGVIMVPQAAVFGSGDEVHCWTASATGEVVRTPVELGPSKGNEVVVYGELTEGQRVLLHEPKP